MKITQISKQLNNTELGKGSTNDSYVLIPNELYVEDIFEVENRPIVFSDFENNEKVELRYTNNLEKRIVGLGNYYRNKNLSAGDEIIFARRSSSSIDEHRIGIRRLSESIVYKKTKKGIEILTSNRMHLVERWNQLIDDVLEINYLMSAKKRFDSPEDTDYYDVLINGESIRSINNCSTGIISIKDKKIVIDEFYGWKRHESEWEEI